MFKIKKSWRSICVISLLILVIVTAILFVSNNDNAPKAISYNKLSISKNDIDSDLKELAKNKYLNSALKNANTKFIINNKLQPTYKASWVNIKLQSMPYEEEARKQNTKVIKQDLKDAETEAKKLFITGDANISEEKIWNTFTQKFRERTINSLVYKIALTRTSNKLNESDIKNYYNKNKDTLAPTCETKKSVSKIVVKTEKDAKIILDKLKNGEDFATLAKNNSIDETTKQNGGSIGCYDASLFPSELNTYINALNINDISKRIKYQNSYYILKTTNYISKNYDGLKPEIKKILTDSNLKKLSKKIETDMKKAEIKVSSEYGVLSQQNELPVITYLS